MNRESSIWIALAVIALVIAGVWFYMQPKPVATEPEAATEEVIPIAHEEREAAPIIPAPRADTDYMGNWFKVTHPAEFVAKAEGVVGSKGTSDEASFTSPDGRVQFYVYSPLWSGDPESYLAPLPSEVVVSDETQSKNDDRPMAIYPHTVVRWVTLEAKDGSYKRSYVSTKSGYADAKEEAFHLVFGIRYVDQAAYQEYLDEYVAFKKSLVQYAD